MLSWGAKRRFIVLAIAILIVVLIFTWYGFAKFYAPPSCTDGKQNQEELGVDCGGPCARLCPNQAPDLIVRWQRSFPVTNASYNALAYIESSNPRLGSKNVNYIFKLYNKENVLVAERAGTTTIPPQRIVPIFEGDIRTGNRVPNRIVFQFEGTPVWETLSAVGPNVAITDQDARDLDSLPLISALLRNNSAKSLHNVAVAVIVYDKDNNARAASQTVVESVKALESADLLFSWPTPFAFSVGRIEIVPRLYPGLQY
ncbi:MAG TPA: hypothetical protein VJH94_02785 [Candidatus Paceibacterota bacterium]